MFARSEASVSRFNLRRVVRFTYPRCAFQTMHMPYPLPLPLSLPGLGIRTELKGVCLSLFGPNLAVFIFLFPAWTMWFWPILAKKTCFGRIWPGKVVLVNFGRETGFDRKNWFRPILAGKNGLRQFWPEKLGVDQKNKFWAHLGSFGLIWA